MSLARRLAASLLLAAVVPATAGDDALGEARTILAGADRDPPAIERARDLLERAVAPKGLARADPPLLIELAKTWYLYGELRTSENAEMIAAFGRGRVVGQQAALRAPADANAHLWYAINLARWAQERGILRSVLEIGTIKHEVAEVLRLEPDLPDAHVFAATLAKDLPRFLGGDRAEAEKHYRRAVDLDPRRSRFRLELAEYLIENARPEEARRHVEAVLAETAPSDPLFAALRDRPRAQQLLAELSARAASPRSTPR